MKTHNLFTAMILFVAGIVLAVSQATATPSVDTLNVQGYMKKANGAAVADGTYTMAIGVFQNGTAVWAKQYAVTVTNGLFAQALTGSGGDLSAAVPAGTGMRSSFLAATLNPALLSSAAAGSVMIRVYAVSTIDGANPQFDISLGSTPTAYVAALAQGVEAGSVTLPGIAAASKSNVGGGAHAGKLTLLDAGGLLDLTMIPSLPASQVTSGQIGVSNGGTGSSTGSITGTGNVTYQSAAGSTTTIGNNATTSTVVLQSGTGGISGTVTGATGNVDFTAGATSGAINITPGTTSGTVTVGSASSTGASTFGNAGGASATTIQSGTGHILLSPSGAGTVRVTNGNGLNLVNGTGSITVNAPTNPTSYTFQLPSTAGTSGYVLQTDGAGATSWAHMDLASMITGTLPVANGGTGATTAAAARTNLSAAQSGANTDITGLNPTGALGVGGAATTAVNITPSGTNAAVSIASAGTGLLTVGGAGTGASTFGNSGAASATTLQSGAGADLTLSAGTGNHVVFSNANGLKLVNGTGNIIVSSPLNPTSWSMVLPSTAGSGNDFLMTNGFGTTSWANPFASPPTIGSTTPGAASFTTVAASGQITSTLATGTAPFVVASTTNVPNLNASSLNGATFASPGAIGGTTPAAAAFTTVSASGQITSTVASGTPPFVVASTDNVPNLNASSLNGATFASPGAIGGTTPAAGTFTTLSATTTMTVGIANNATGTAVKKLAVMTSTGLQTAATNSTTVVGIVVSGAGTTGTAQVATNGIATCTFDASSAVTAGNYVAISTTTAGTCADVGTQPKGSKIIGIATTSGAAGSDQSVLVSPTGNMPITQVSMKTVTATGTYTPTAGTLYFIAEVVGSGGGGGATAAANGAAGSGGGAGSYAKVVCPISEVNGTAAVTVNAAGGSGAAGGTVSLALVNGTVTSNGGGAGVAGAATSAKIGGAGGAISTNTDANCTSIVLTPGQPGQSSVGVGAAVATAMGGVGAYSPFGSGGINAAGALGNGGNASGYGAGGGGAASAGAAQTGGSGSNGIVIITEFRAF